MPALDRRAFLAASVSVVAGRRLPALPVSPVLFVVDRRFAAHGAALHADMVFIEGDVTALWRDRLRGLWQVDTASVGGITGPAALFCLEQLARGHGRKVSIRRPIPGTDAIRWVIAPVSPRGFT